MTIRRRFELFLDARRRGAAGWDVRGMSERACASVVAVGGRISALFQAIREHRNSR
jgi:hypothetical protein